MWCSETNQNGANIYQKTGLKSTPQLVSILEPTWLHFGMVLGVKMGPSWHQIAPKIDLQIDQKNDRILNPSWHRFWTILDPNLAPKRGPKKSLFEVILALEAVLGPRWPQDPPRVLPRPSQRVSGTDLEPILDDFGWFWNDFSSFFNWFFAPLLIDIWQLIKPTKQINKPINQPINRSTTQSNKPIHHPMNRSTNQPSIPGHGGGVGRRQLDQWKNQ